MGRRAGCRGAIHLASPYHHHDHHHQPLLLLPHHRHSRASRAVPHCPSMPTPGPSWPLLPPATAFPLRQSGWSLFKSILPRGGEPVGRLLPFPFHPPPRPIPIPPLPLVGPPAPPAPAPPAPAPPPQRPQPHPHPHSPLTIPNECASSFGPQSDQSLPSEVSFCSH